MRITDVRAVQPPSEGGPQDWRATLGQILVAVEMDTGVRGIGVGGGGMAGVHVIESTLRPLLVGEEVDGVAEIERLWEKLWHATLAYGRKGLAIMAISGIDLALWDAVARAADVSVYQLLRGVIPESGTPLDGTARSGGVVRVPCYITGPAPEDAVARGFRAVKLPCGTMTPEESIARVADVRRRVGPDVQLMVDAFGRWDLRGSLRAADAMARHDVGWLEEPLPPDDLEGYAKLAAQSPVPIAGGEHEYTVHGFRELAAHGAHHVWQPDVCWTGGLTQLRAIYALARVHGVRVVPHRGAEVWSLHAIAALDPDPLAESGRPWLTWLHDQPQPEAGYVAVPGTPGFSVEADDALAESEQERK